MFERNPDDERKERISRSMSCAEHIDEVERTLAKYRHLIGMQITDGTSAEKKARLTADVGHATTCATGEIARLRAEFAEINA